jgi:lysophospholipase L1-like esterase
MMSSSNNDVALMNGRAARLTGAAGSFFWATLALAAGYFWLRWAPDDLFSALLALGLAGWTLASALGWLWARRRGGREALFAWGGAQVAALLLVAGLGLAEAVAQWSERRWKHWEETTPDYPDTLVDQDSAMRPPHQGGLMRPNVDLEVKGARQGQTVHFHTNSLGFRNQEETSVEKPANTIRVLMLGDSFIAGYRMADEDVFGVQLREEILRAAAGEAWLSGKEPWLEGKRLEVLNAATQDPVSAWYFLQEHASKLSPDLVILNITLANDFFQALYFLGDLPRLKDSFYTINAAGRLEVAADERYPELRDAVLAYIEGTLYPPEAMIPEEEFDPNSLKLPDEINPSPWALGRLLDGLIAQSGGYVGASEAPWPKASLFHYGQTAIMLKDRPEPIERAYGAMEQSLSGWARWSQESGVPILATAIPLRHQVIPQDRQATFEDSTLLPEAHDPEMPNRFLAEICQRLGLRFLDLGPGFAERGEEAARYFLAKRDCHWNAEGYGEASRLLAPAAIEALRSGAPASSDASASPATTNNQP